MPIFFCTITAQATCRKTSPYEIRIKIASWVQDRKRQKVEILKPVQPKVEKAGPAADAAEGAGEDVKSQAGGDTLAEGGPPDGPAANGAVDEEPELSTESDEARPGKEAEEVSS